MVSLKAKKLDISGIHMPQGCFFDSIPSGGFDPQHSFTAK